MADIQLTLSDWIQYKSGKHFKWGSAANFSAKALRALPENQGKMFFWSYPLEGMPEQADPNVVQPVQFRPKVSPHTQAAMDAVKASFEELGIEATYNYHPVVKIEELRDPETHALLRGMMPGPDVFAASVIALDAKQESLKAAYDVMWADEGFKERYRERARQHPTSAYSPLNPFTGIALVPELAAAEAARHMALETRWMREAYQKGAAAGVQEELKAALGHAFIAKYDLRAGDPAHPPRQTRNGIDALSEGDMQALHMLEPWLEYKTGVKFNYLPDGTRNRLKRDFAGSISLSLNLSYPEMPKPDSAADTQVIEGDNAGTVATIGNPNLFANPQAEDVLAKAKAALEEVGVPFSETRNLHDPRNQGTMLHIGTISGSTNARMEDDFDTIAYHTFAISPTAEGFSEALTRIYEDEGFRAWCAGPDTEKEVFKVDSEGNPLPEETILQLQSPRKGLPTMHPYTGHGFNKKQTLDKILSDVRSRAVNVESYWEKAAAGGYTVELEEALTPKRQII